MKKKLLNLPAMAGLVVAGLLAMAAHSAMAATWDGAWSAWTPRGAEATCSSPQSSSFKGHSAINGNDSGQVLAYCAHNNQWTCGSVTGKRLVARAHACPSSNTDCETTDASTGKSVGSSAGGLPHANHTCQMGWESSVPR